MALDKGTTLAGYRINGILGQGGMGVVYEATQISLNRTVALKVLAPHLSQDITFRERFQREGQIQAGIDHDHIVTVYDSGDSDHGFFIAMRLIRGPNLKDMIVSRELDPGRTLRILSPIASALDTAHAAGLIHRDVKPQNVLVGGRDQAFLADFGLTKGTGEKSLTKTGQFVGTFDYVSPEQIKGERATTKSDVYALAAVLYECFTGVVPFPKDSEAAVLYAHMADDPPKITEHRPELPASLDAVIAAGMAKDPDDRQPSAGELLLDTNRAFTRRMRAAFTPPGPLETPQETGIRQAEVDVSTREAEAAAAEPPTEEAALEAETEVTPAAETAPAEAPEFDKTVQAGAAPDVTVPGAPAPDVTKPGEPAPDVTVPGAPAPDVTVPGAQTPDVTVAGAQAPDVTVPGKTAEGKAPDRTVPGETPSTLVLPTEADGPSEPGAPAARPAPAKPEDRRPLLAAAALLLVVVVGLGFLLGSSGGSEDDGAPAADNSAAGGVLELSFPDSWARATDPPAIPGLKLENQLALTEKEASKDDALAAGTTDATGPSLLPAAFLDRLPDEPKRDDAVKLGDLDAYRYAGLQPEGGEGRLTVYVVPTTVGVVTVACSAATAGAKGFLPACEDVAGTLNLVNGEAFPLGADEDYLTALDKAMDRLNSDRKSDVAKLRKAKTQGGQASAATALSKDYARAAESLRGLEVSPAVQDAADSVNEALTDTSKAYSRLAKAARGDNAGAYNAASKDVKQGEAALKRALAQVQAAG